MSETLQEKIERVKRMEADHRMAAADWAIEFPDDLAISQAATRRADALAALLEIVEGVQTPAFYWRTEAPDYALGSINEGIDDGCYLVGEIVELTPVCPLPNIFVLVGEEDTDHQVFDTREAAEKAKEKPHV